MDELVVAYESGLSLREVAESFGIGRTTVIDHLRRQGVKLRERSPFKLSAEQVDEAARRYQAGESLTKLAPEFGVRRHTLADALKRVGHEVVPGKRKGRK